MTNQTIEKLDKLEDEIQHKLLLIRDELTQVLVEARSEIRKMDAEVLRLRKVISENAYKDQ